MTKKKIEPNENAVAGSADEKKAIMENSSITQSNPEAVADRTTPVAPSQRDQLPAETASADGDHPHNGGNDRGNADAGQPRIEPPDNREKIPQNRESTGAVGYGRPPVASRFRPGRSGNPGGRSKTLPISEGYQEKLETRLPKEVRLRVEGKLGMKLHKGATYRDAMAEVTFMSALGCFELGRGLMAVREIREAVEGKVPQRIFVPEPPVQEDPDELRKHIWAKLIETSYNRHKLYGMEMPELEQMATDAGVNLQEAMGDKPSPPEASIGDKKP
jgi:hypothetical protein